MFSTDLMEEIRLECYQFHAHVTWLFLHLVLMGSVFSWRVVNESTNIAIFSDELCEQYILWLLIKITMCITVWYMHVHVYINLNPYMYILFSVLMGVGVAEIRPYGFINGKIWVVYAPPTHGGTWSRLFIFHGMTACFGSCNHNSVRDLQDKLCSKYVSRFTISTRARCPIPL